MDEGADQRRGSDGGSVGDVFFIFFIFLVWTLRIRVGARMTTPSEMRSLVTGNRFQVT